MIASALVVAAVAVQLAPAAGGGESVAKFSLLRVCGATAFSRKESRCTHDERRLRITSNRISCSATLVVRRPGSWRVRFSYQHHVAPWTRGGTVSVGANHLWHNVNIGTDMPVPGGNWRCDFSFGPKIASIVFRSGGPRGEIVDTAVCSEAHVLSFGSRQRDKRCGQDNSTTPFVDPQRIYCSAVFAHPASNHAMIELLGPQGNVLTSTNLVIRSSTISQSFGSVDGSLLAAPGSYGCRVSLEDGTTVTKQFQIASGA